VGLADFGARFYKPWIGRFIQPDTIVPDWTNPQTLNRYSLAYNNPLKYNDPTGHFGSCPFETCPSPLSPSLGIASIVEQHTGTAWEQLPSAAQSTLTQQNWDAATWNAEYGGGGNVRDVAGTLQDPAVLAAMAYGAGRLAPAIAAIGEAVSWKALTACSASIICGSVLGLGGAGIGRGAASSARLGVTGEEAVSQSIGIARNVGPGRVTIPGTGPGGYRVPDFDPNLTIGLRNSVVEVKNVQSLSITPQLRDLAAYADHNNVVLEIFTNAPTPTRGELARLIERNLVILRAIP
jgi:hypothetical protein